MRMNLMMYSFEQITNGWLLVTKNPLGNNPLSVEYFSTLDELIDYYKENCWKKE